MPGFTPMSMFPRMWAASGLDYPALVDRLVRTALRRGTGLRCAERWPASGHRRLDGRGQVDQRRGGLGPGVDRGTRTST